MSKRGKVTHFSRRAFVVFVAGLTIHATQFGCSPSKANDIHIVVIDSVLGRRSRPVPGIESMSQVQIAGEAAALAMDVEGWDLAQCAAFSTEFSWGNGSEWTVYGAWEECSNNYGYPINDQARENLGRRHLMFHTDDTISHGPHNVGEPSPFGVISGFMDGTFYQLGVMNWGTFGVETIAVPPRVLGVAAAGSTWNAAAYALPVGTSGQTAPLSFTSIDQIKLTFDEQVTIGSDHATLIDTDGNPIVLAGPVTGAGEEPSTYVATWQVDAPLGIGRYTLSLSDGVVDGDGHALDGEWTNEASTISGDGQPGGIFAFSFNILPGDVNQNGAVTIVDAIEVRNLVGTSMSDPAYSALHDIDASGAIDAADVSAVLVRSFDVLPPPLLSDAAAIPEPSGLASCAVLGAAVLVGSFRFSRHSRSSRLRQRG